MTVTELLQHLSEGRTVQTKHGEFALSGTGVKYRGTTFCDFGLDGPLQCILDAYGEAVWLAKPPPIAKLSVYGGWSVSCKFPGYMLRGCYVKPEHVEAFEKHVEAFGREG